MMNKSKVCFHLVIIIRFFFLFAKKRDEKPFKIAKAKIRYEWTTILSTC